MDNVIKHYIDILKRGKKICAKKHDGAEINFYINEEGNLISEDENGLTTDTGLSYLELQYVLETGNRSGDYLIEEAEGNTPSVGDLSRFESMLERARIIHKQLSENGYDLDSIYKRYNHDKKVEELIDTLSTEVLELFESKAQTAEPKALEECEKQKDVEKLLGNLYASGKIIVGTSDGVVREYTIEGGILRAADALGNVVEGFLAATQLKYDIDGIVLGEYEAGIIVPEIAFTDEKANERVKFGIEVARAFSNRLEYTQEDFVREYDSDLEFKYGVDRQDRSVLYRAETSEPVPVDSIARDALSGVAKGDIQQYGKILDRGFPENNKEMGEI